MTLKAIFYVGLTVSAIFIGLRVGNDILRSIPKPAPPAPPPATGQ